METAKKTDHAKYDRQLRLWGEEGQSFLEDSKVCLINATATGCETLKNLVLPGIGNFTIVDGNKVQMKDFNNFFIVEGSLGRSRAEVTKETLTELNDLVTGSFLERDPVDLINSEPDYFKQFTIVVVNDLPEDSLLKLGKICWDNSIVLIVVRVSGFVGYIRVIVPEHTIIESKPDNPIDDLRIANPFPELEKYADAIDMSTLNSTDHSHTPFIVLLLKEVKKWKASHGGKFPENYSEKSVFKKAILDSKLNSDEQNFDEAFKASFKAFPTKMPSTTQAILRDPQSLQITPQSSKFWILAAAVREFVDNEGAGNLPLMGSIPDMHATTTSYIALQRIFIEKASQDVEAVTKRVKNILKSVGKQEDLISADEIKKFCKNSHFLQCVRYRSLEDERASPKTADLKSRINDPDSNAVWDVALRAADRFEAVHKRYPGAVEASVEDDIVALKKIAQDITTELKLDTPIDDKYVQELVRYGDSELHTMASLFGGVTSQEIIKLITHQYLPLDNTFVYNGIISTTTTFSV